MSAKAKSAAFRLVTAPHPGAVTRSRFSFPYLGTSPEKDLRTTLICTPLWILLLLQPIVVQLVSFWVGVKVLLSRRQQGRALRFPGLAGGFLLLFCLSYTTSILVNLDQISPVNRLVGTLYNLSLWFAGLLILLVVRNTASRGGFELWLRGLRSFGVLIGVIACVGLVAWSLGYAELQIRSPLLPFLPRWLQEEPLFSTVTRIEVLESSWFFVSVPRCAGVEISATALGIVLVTTILATVRLSQIETTGLARTAGYFVPQFIGFALTHARGAAVALMVAAFHWAFLRRRPVWGTVVLGLVVALATLSYTGAVDFAGVWNDVFVRPRGSLEGRTEVWEATLRLWQEQPWLGWGMKPRFHYLPVSVASHSAYLGLLARTGGVGLGLVLLFLASLYVGWYRQEALLRGGQLKGHWRCVGSMGVAFLIWMLTEDLDAPPVAAFLFFVTFGYATALARVGPGVVTEQQGRR